ncbi:hypothetical protein GCM10017687_51570 [Streptomyces echinatus]
MHGEDPVDALEHAVRDGVQGTAGQHLLGGLEEQPHRAGQQALGVQVGEDQSGAEDDGGVHVVAAGVGPVRHGRPVGAFGLGVRDGQGVDVGAQREQRFGRPLALGEPDVAHESGSGAEDAGLEPGLLQPRLDRGGGAELLVAQFRVHVQVATEGDEFGVQGLAQHAGEHIPRKAGLGL